VIPARLQVILGNLRRWEGDIPHMYQDDGDPPTVTCAIGEALFSAADAILLPFMANGGSRRATADEIADEWDRVHGMQGAHRPDFYRSSNPLELTTDARGAITVDKLTRRYLPDIQHHLAVDFDGLPFGWQEGLIDIAWNTGSLAHWPSLCKAIDAGDKVKASLECRRDPGRTRAERNEWTRLLFLNG
jgi:hypothetical protein